MKQTVKILFADDDLKYSMILKRFLEREGYEVTYVGNGEKAIAQFAVVKPDLVLLDINMPGLNGFEVAEKIREKDKHTLIFFLSDRSDKSDRLKGFSLKGNDYLPKPFYPEELLARIKERFEQSAADALPDERYTFGNTLFNYNTNELQSGTHKSIITSRQADILRLLARNAGQTVSREQLLNAIWGDTSYANSLALNVQITYLRKALVIDTWVELIVIPRKGYSLRMTE